MAVIHLLSNRDMTTLELLLNNLDELRDAYRDNPSHQMALDRFNAATGNNLKLGTLKALAPAILGTVERLNNECLTRLNTKCLTAKEKPPKNWKGWSVQTDKKGYTRLYKKMGGHLKSVYIGRWSEEAVTEKMRKAGHSPKS